MSLKAFLQITKQTDMLNWKQLLRLAAGEYISELVADRWMQAELAAFVIITLTIISFI